MPKGLFTWVIAVCSVFIFAMVYAPVSYTLQGVPSSSADGSGLSAQLLERAAMTLLLMEATPQALHTAAETVAHLGLQALGSTAASTASAASAPASAAEPAGTAPQANVTVYMPVVPAVVSKGAAAGSAFTSSAAGGSGQAAAGSKSCVWPEDVSGVPAWKKAGYTWSDTPPPLQVCGFMQHAVACFFPVKVQS